MFIIEKLALFYTNFCWHWELVNMLVAEMRESILLCSKTHSDTQRFTALVHYREAFFFFLIIIIDHHHHENAPLHSFRTLPLSLSFSSQHVFYECFLKIYRRFIFRKSLFQCASIRKKYRSTLYHDFLWFPRSVYLWYENSNVFTVDFHMMMAFKI